MAAFVHVDGSRGEGGGQILRTSLALSLLTGRPFRMERIRAGRAKPGLMRQHLVAVRAAAQISGAKVEGAELHSQQLTFHPGPVKGGAYVFPIGSAGSASLVLQTILLPLAFAKEPSHVEIEGGTHNPHAPPFEFLARAYLPLLSRMGLQAEVRLVRAGFYPAGGGRLVAAVVPVRSLSRLELTDRGELTRFSAIAKVAHLPRDIGVREVRTFADALGWDPSHTHVESLDSVGPGNALVATLECAQATEVFTAIGERGVKAEDVAGRLAAEVRAWLAAEVPVGEHLADQLLLPLAVGDGGAFTTVRPSDHFTTQVETLAHFLGSTVEVRELRSNAFLVEIKGIRHPG